MANQTVYKVKLVGENSELLKVINNSQNAVRAFQKEANEISFRLKLENPGDINTFIRDVNRVSPSVAVQVRYDIQKESLDALKREKEELENRRIKWDPVINSALGLGLDKSLTSEEITEARKKARLEITNYLDKLQKDIVKDAKKAKPEDIPALRERIQSFLDINKYFHEQGGFGLKFGAPGGVLNLFNSTGINLKGLAGRSMEELEGKLKRAEYEFNTARDKVIARGLNPEDENKVFDEAGELKRAAEEAEQLAQKAKDAQDAANSAGEAAENAGKKAKGAAKEASDALNDVNEKIQETGNGLNNFTRIDGIDNLVKNIQKLLDVLQQVLGITESVSSNGVLENILKGAVEKGYTTSQHLSRYLKGNLPEELADDKYLKQLIVSKSGLSETSKNIRGDYDEWASEVVAAMKEAGKAVDAFEEKKMKITENGVFGNTKINDDQLKGLKQGFVDAAKLITESGIFNIKTDQLENFLDLIKEIVYELQRANGITANSRLDEEFSRIVKDAETLGSGSLNKLNNGYQQLQNIVERFNQYKQAGGTKKLSDITDNEELLDRLKRVTQETKTATKEIDEAVKAEQQSMAQTIKEVASALNSLNIDELLGRFKDLYGVLNSPIDEGSFLKELETLASFGPVLDNLAKVLGESSVKIKSATKTITSTQKETSGSAELDALYKNAIALQGTLDNYERRGVKSIGGMGAQVNLQEIIDYYNQMKLAGAAAFTLPDDKLADFTQYINEARGALEDFASVDEKVRASAQDIRQSEESIINTFKELGRDASKYASEAFSEDKIVNKSSMDRYLQMIQSSYTQMRTFNKTYTDEVSADVATEMTKNIEAAMSGAGEKMRSALINQLAGLKSSIGSSPYLANMFSGAINQLIDTSLINKIDGNEFIAILSKIKNLKSGIDVESDGIKKSVDSIMNNIERLNSESKIFIKDSSSLTKNANQVNFIDSYIKSYEQVQGAVANFEQKYGYIPDGVTKQIQTLTATMQKALSDALGITSKIDSAINSDKYKKNITNDLVNLKGVLSPISDIVSNFDTSKMWDVDSVRNYLGVIKQVEDQYNKIIGSASGEDLIKNNQILTKDRDRLAGIKQQISALNDGALQIRFDALSKAFANFDPAVNSISSLRKAMADLQADAKTAAEVVSKAAKNAAAAATAQNKKIADDFRNLGKNTKEINKLMGVETMNDVQKNYWNNYFKQFEAAQNSIAGKQLNDVAQKQVNASAQEIAKILEESVTLNQKIDEMSKSGGFTEDYITRLGRVKSGIEDIINAFPKGNFDISKVLGLDPATLKNFFDSINAAKVELGKSSENQMAKVADVQKTLNDALALKGASNNGKINSELDGLINKLDTAVQSSNGLKDSFTNMSSKELDEVTGSVVRLRGEAERTGARVITFGKNLASQMTSQMASLVAQYTSIRFMFRYAKQIAKTVTAVDSAITELRKVSGESNIRLAESFKTSAATAQELGATITDVINSTADWARLGYNIDQAEDLARVTQLLQTVGDNMTQETASKSLVSILQGYKIDASQAERTVDSINEVANNFAIDTAGIGEALQRSAAALNASGTDLNKSIALVTTSNAVLQNPETVGTMFKTMSARIRGATTELNELGEEEDEFTQTTSKLRDLVMQLTGFDIMKDENTYKDIYEIILGIGKEWKNLTDIEQASLGEALGGKRGINALFSVLNNTEGLEKAYKTALGAEGSAAREQAAYAQSVQYSIDRMKASAQELSVNFMSSDFLKGVVEGANTFLQLLTKIADKLGTLGSIVTALGAIDLIKTLLTGGRRGLGGTVIMSLAKALNGNNEIKGLGNAFKLITLKAGEAGTNAGGLMAKNMFAALASSPGAAVAGIAIATAIGVAIYSYLKKRQQDLINDAKTAANQWEEKQKTMSERYDEASSLRKQLEDETLSETQRLDIKKQIYEIQKQITSEYGAQASGIDLINGDLEEQKKLLTQISEAQARANLVEHASEYEAAIKKATGEYSGHAAEILGESDEFEQQLIKIITESGLDTLKYSFTNGDVGNLNIDYNGTAKEITEDVNTMIAKLQELRAEAENDKTSAILADPDNAKAISKNYDVQISAIDEAIEQFSSRTKKIRDGYEEIKSTYESYLEQEFFAAGGGILATEASDIASQLQDAIIEGNRSGAYALYKEYQKKESEIAELAKKISWDDGSLKVYMDSVKNGFDESSIEGFRLLDVLDMVNSSYNQVAEAADDYNKIVAEGNELGIDRGKTTYGNIDLEDRAVVNWDKETLKKYGDALKSWGRDTGEYEDIFREQGEAAAEAWLDGYVESYEGSYSTVDAGSSAFMIDGKEVEIAFTPLLQTGDGRAEYLDKNTVYDYINAVIQRASEEGDVSMENILRIDAGSTIEGFEGIHGLIADIGESAIQTGEAMHYIGTLGAENDAFERYTNVVGVLMDKIGDDNPFKDQAEDIIKYSTAIKSAGLDTVDVQQILAGEAVNATDEVKQAIMELLELTGMTGDALNNALAASGIIFGGVDKEIQHIQQSFSGFTNEMQKRYSNLDSLNGSLVAAVSGKGLNPFGEKDEEGNISSEVGNITKAFKDLDSFHPEDVFRHTANGIKLNEKELRRLQKEQDKVTHKKFLQKQKELTKQLADAERKRNSETNESKIRGYENEISTIRKSLMELGQLQAAYEGATSAYQKWLNAQSVGEAGDVYDNMRENMTKRADELYKEGLTGTEEFRALAELISGKDLSTANVDAVEAAYKNLDASIKGTDQTVRKFFEEGGQGALNFIDAMKDLGYATEENGIVSFEYLDTEEFAKKLGTSVDIVEAALNKLKDYGFEIQWFTKEQNKALKKFDKQYSGTIDKYKNVKFGRDERIFNVDELNTVEELEGAYNSIQEMLQNPTIFGIDDSQAQALSELLDVIIKKKDILAMPTGREMFTVENYNIAKEALQQVINEVEEANRLGLTSLTDSTKDAAEYISSLDDDIKDFLANDLGIELDLKLSESGEELLNSLGYGTSNNGSQQQKKPSVKIKAERENEYSEKHTNITKNEIHSVENIQVTADTSGLEIATQAVEAFKAGLPPEEIAMEIVCDVLNIESIEELKNEQDQIEARKLVQVIAEALGKGDLVALNAAINKIKSKSVTVTATVNDSAINRFTNAWDSWTPKQKDLYIKYHTSGNSGPVTYNGKDFTYINGTAHALGTLSGYAHAGGKWGLPSNQKALINEVGPEAVVRDGRWFIPNGGRPTMDFPLRKGDIIFNAKQTEELLKNGYVTRGYAHANGTAGGLAYAGATGSGATSRLKKTTSSSSSKSSSSSNSSSNSDSKKAAEEAAEEVKDWIEVLLDRITRAFENFKEMSDYWSSYVNKNRELNNAISQAQKNITYNQQAYARYMKQANSVGLSDKYAKQVQNGTIDIEKIKDEKLREKIDQYTEWYLIMPTQSIMIA